MTVLIILFIDVQAFAIFDWAAARAEDALKAAYYADAISELVQAVSPDDEIAQASRTLSEQTHNLRSEAQSMQYLSQDTKSILSGPDFTGKRLDQNIRQTARYIKRTKDLWGKVAILGSNGVATMSAIEANDRLDEIRKNQAAQLALDANYQQMQMRKEVVESKKWENFISEQRAIRRASAVKKGNE